MKFCGGSRELFLARGLLEAFLLIAQDLCITVHKYFFEKCCLFRNPPAKRQITEYKSEHYFSFGRGKLLDRVCFSSTSLGLN